MTLIRHPLPCFEFSDRLYPERLLPKTLVFCLSSALAASADTDMDERSLASFTVHWTKHRTSRLLSDCRLGSTSASELLLCYVWLRSALFCYRRARHYANHYRSYKSFIFLVCIAWDPGSVPGKAMQDLWRTKRTVAGFVTSWKILYFYFSWGRIQPENGTRHGTRKLKNLQPSEPLLGNSIRRLNTCCNEVQSIISDSTIIICGCDK
jgi:hypothetical protein